MNLIFRLLFTLIVSPFRSKGEIEGECATPFRVWFTDLDVLFHMNNGKYFSLMDLARTDMMIRAGLLKKAKSEKIYPVVAAEMMKFKRSLKLFQKFYIHTRVIGWDEKNIFLEQSFKNKEKVFSYAVIKAQFLRTNGNKVLTQELLEIIGIDKDSIKLPDEIKDWSDSLDQRFNYLEPHS